MEPLFVTIDTKNFNQSSVKYIQKMRPFNIMFLGDISEIDDWKNILDSLKNVEFVAVPFNDESLIHEIKNFKNCIAALKKVPSGKINEKYEVVLEIRSKTIRNIDQIVENCKKMGAVELLLIRDFEANLTSEDFKALSEKIEKHGSYVSVSECPFFYVSKKNISGGCIAGWGGLHIRDDTIFPCFGINVEVEKIENFDNAFDSEIMRMLRDREKIKGKCRKCDYLYSCGGCRAYGFIKYNDMYWEDEMCWR